MMVIHQGTVIQSTFSVVDENGDIIESFTINANPNEKDDPLRIRCLNQANFIKAHEVLIKIRDELKNKV